MVKGVTGYQERDPTGHQGKRAVNWLSSTINAKRTNWLSRQKRQTDYWGKRDPKKRRRKKIRQTGYQYKIGLLFISVKEANQLSWQKEQLVTRPNQTNNVNGPTSYQGKRD